MKGSPRSSSLKMDQTAVIAKDLNKAEFLIGLPTSKLEQIDIDRFLKYRAMRKYTKLAHEVELLEIYINKTIPIAGRNFYVKKDKELYTLMQGIENEMMSSIRTTFGSNEIEKKVLELQLSTRGMLVPTIEEASVKSLNQKETRPSEDALAYICIRRIEYLLDLIYDLIRYKLSIQLELTNSNQRQLQTASTEHVYEASKKLLNKFKSLHEKAFGGNDSKKNVRLIRIQREIERLKKEGYKLED